MNEITVTLSKWSLGGLATALGYYSGWSDLMLFLIILMFLDFSSGLIAGGVTGTLRSTTGFKGIARKLMIIAVVVACHIADLILQVEQVSVMGMEVTSPIQSLAIMFYCGNELLSILENCSRANVPFPKFIKERFEQMKEKGNGQV